MRRFSFRTGLLLLVLFAAALNASEDGRQVYIVYLGHLPTPEPSEPEGFSAAVEASHHDLLGQVLDDDSATSDRILHSYKRSLNGFAARLTEEEAQKLSSTEGIVSIFPSRNRELLTTRSWDFLGFPQTSQEELTLEGDVIVGMLDSGVWPDSPSFDDDGMGPPPSRWKGACQNFTCNNKIIGARAYRHGATGMSPLDDNGHGSHTASTVAGRAVGNVSFGGLAAGTARGAVPGARLAVYKVCWLYGHCGEADILAAFDDAIADGVDVISLSIGGLAPLQYFEDAAAIGSFHAMRRGVLTSAGAGNAGDQDNGSVCNVAPWMLSVAASSTDRQLVDKIVLGNGKTIVGASINTFPPVRNATIAFPVNGSCNPDDLARGSYKDKIVLCAPLEINIGIGPRLADVVAGTVLVGDQPDVSFIFPLPGLLVTLDQFDEIMAYVNNTSNPVGTIGSTETTTDLQAPKPASFSSMGPNLITPGILKPDLSAPGIEIIASWSPLSRRKVLYSIDSGTSMACPHASGAAAYVKSFHRDWSPAMIMSALITTATPMNTPGNSGTNELKYGAGQLNPTKARNPGLVYDASEHDYIAMLCAQGYNATALTLITGSNATACAAADAPAASSVGDLNYPTMAAQVEPSKNFTVVFPRTVTNVGDAAAVYNVKVVLSIGATGNLAAVDVSPSRLEFSEQNPKASFTVTVAGVAPGAGRVVSSRRPSCGLTASMRSGAQWWCTHRALRRTGFK